MIKPIAMKPKSWVVIRSVAWVTFIEIIRDKVLYNIVLCAILLFGLAILVSQLTFIYPERVILDFGMTGMVLSCGAIAIFTGSGLLAKEFDRRTINIALSHPISRRQFVAGKFAGLVGVLAVNWVLLGALYLTLLGLLSPTWNSSFSMILFVALFLVCVESVMMASLAVLFSAFSTTSLSVIFSLGVVLIGNNISHIRLLARQSSSKQAWIFQSIAMILPNFEHFSLGVQVSYGFPVPWSLMGLGVLYSSVMIALCLILAGLVIQAREV